MKKVFCFVIILAVAISFVGVALAGGKDTGFKMGYPALYSKIYDITMPAINAPNVSQNTYDGSWFCGDTNVVVNTRYTDFAYVQNVQDLTKYSVGNISLTGSVDQGYDPRNMTDFLSFDYYKKLVKIAYASQYCEQQYDFDCDTNPGTCICKTTSSNVVCEDVYYNIVPGSNLIMVVRPLIVR